jgi:N-acetylneuraminate lyase
MNIQNFRLIAAPFSAMQPDGSLDLGAVNAQAAYLVNSGARGAFVAGTSGEGQSLTLDERMSLAETWANDQHRNRLEVIIHVGHNCQSDAVRLAAHSAAVGADAIAMHAPSWFRQPSVDDLIEFCVPIANAARDLPFYFYDIPRISGVHLSAAKFLAQAKAAIPTLCGVKYTNPDCITAQECIQLNGGTYDILWGTDETLLAGVSFGAAGAVGSTYNFAAPLYLRMLTALESDNWRVARIEQARAVRMVRIFEQYPTLAALKFAMSLVGVDCGPVRPPIGNLSATDQQSLRDELEEFGFLNEITPIDSANPVVPTIRSAC